MKYDLSQGEAISIAQTVLLTVIAVEGNSVRFRLELLEGDCAGADGECQEAVPTNCRWELN
jgi:hypothetical protein